MKMKFNVRDEHTPHDTFEIHLKSRVSTTSDNGVRVGKLPCQRNNRKIGSLSSSGKGNKKGWFFSSPSEAASSTPAIYSGRPRGWLPATLGSTLGVQHLYARLLFVHWSFLSIVHACLYFIRQHVVPSNISNRL